MKAQYGLPDNNFQKIFFGYRFLSGEFLNYFFSFCLLDLIPQDLLCYHIAIMKEWSLS